MSRHQPTDDDESGLSIWQIIGSTVAAALGVQNRSRRERDFANGKPVHFIIAGIVFTAIFVLLMVVIVRTVVNAAV
jgi:hypothetical protein